MLAGPSSERTSHPHYEILGQCGQGGMGVVYKARDIRLNRIVALKFLLKARAATDDALRRFRREAESIAALNHPNIATLYEIGDWNGEPFLAMEYLPGGPLSSRRRPGGIPYEELRRYAAELGGGLSFAHSKGILHRDIKPGNGMFSEHGVLKLVDFGLAKPDSADDITHTGASMGTIGYMAPERLRGGDATVRTDIYALGATLYELAAGRSMFSARNLGSPVDQVLRSPSDLLGSLRPDLPAEFCEAVARATAADAENRYASVAEFLRALGVPGKGLSGEELPTLTLNFPRTAAPGWSGRRKLRWAGAVLLGLAGLAAGIRFGPRLAVAGDQVVVVLPFANLGANTANQALSDGLQEIVTGLLSMAAGSHNLLVVPSSEVRRDHVQTIAEARKQFKADIAITGSVQETAERLRLTLALDDAVKLRQKDFRTIAVASSETAELQDRLAEALSSLFGYVSLAQPERAPGQTTANSVAYSLFLQGTGAVQNRNADAAIDFLQKAVQADPAFAPARTKLAEAYLWKNTFTKDPKWLALADSEVSHAAQGGKGYETAMAQAMIRRATGDNESAIQLFRRLLETEPSNMEAYQLLAQTLDSAGRTAEAEKTLQQAIRLRPGYWPLHNTLGNFYLRHQDYARAEQELKAAAALAPNAVVYSNLGALYFKMGRWAEAASNFETSLATGPNGLAEANLGAVYFYQGRYEDAAVHARKSTEIQPANPMNWGNLGDALWQIPARKEAAREAFEQAALLASQQLSINPSNVALRRTYALYLARLGRAREAAVQIGMAIAQAPNDGDVQFYAARVFMGIGETKRALAALDRCKALGYSRDEIAREPDLAAISNSARNGAALEKRIVK